MNQKTPLSIDELEAMLRIRESLDDAFEEYVLGASEAQLDQLLVAAGVDPATAQNRVVASMREAARRLNEPPQSTTLERVQEIEPSEVTSSEILKDDAKVDQNLQRKSKKILRGLGALATSQIRTVPFKSAEKQRAVPDERNVIGKRDARSSSRERARQNELVLGMASKGSQQHGQLAPDDNFIIDVELNGRPFAAYRDRTPAGEILLVGEFDPLWTFLIAGSSRWPLRPTELDNTRRCEELGVNLFKRLLTAHGSGETRLQFGSSHD